MPSLQEAAKSNMSRGAMLEFHWPFYAIISIIVSPLAVISGDLRAANSDSIYIAIVAALRMVPMTTTPVMMMMPMKKKRPVGYAMRESLRLAMTMVLPMEEDNTRLRHVSVVIETVSNFVIPMIRRRLADWLEVQPVLEFVMACIATDATMVVMKSLAGFLAEEMMLTLVVPVASMVHGCLANF